jgi:uncharacterized membrane protein
VAGPRRASQRKGWQLAGISAALAALSFLVGLFTFLLAVPFPPAAALGALLLILAFALGVFAIFPVVWAWQWNANEDRRPGG